MTGTDTADLGRELQELDATIADLRRTAAQIRRQLGRHEDAPYDLADRAMLITEAEEQEALLAVLEARRESLVQRLSRE